MANSNIKTQTKWMKTYGATDFVFEAAEDESVDSALNFKLDGFECSLQISDYSETVVAWNIYTRDADGYIDGGYFFDSMAAFVKHINPVRGRR